MKTKYFSYILVITSVLLLAKISYIFHNNYGSNYSFFNSVNAKENSQILSENSKNEKEQQTVSSLPKTETLESNLQTEKYSSSQIQLLQELSVRRKEITALENKYKNKQNILSALEGNIEQKMKELSSMQKQIDKTIREYRNIENERIRNLVKIYENMNPKRAALIFDELDKETLAEIIVRMKDSKSGAIMSYMNPIKAKDISIEISKKKVFVTQ